MRSAVFVLIFILALAMSAIATEVIRGTVVASPAGEAAVQVNCDGKVITVKRSEKTVIVRGEVGKKSHNAALRDFMAGDHFEAIIEDGETVTMKATYDPPIRPKINSVTFSAPVPMKPGDIITVDLAGTPGTKAAFAVKEFIPVVKMQEISAGSYHGTVRVPKGKTIRNAPLVGYLGSGDNHAAPVQASRLVTVIDDSDEPIKPTIAPLGMTKPKLLSQPDKLPVIKPDITQEKLPQPKSLPAPELVTTPKPAPAAPPPAAEPKIIPPIPATAKIALTSPVDGGTIKRTILVKGTAEPGSTVKVTITYSNGLAGILKLAGEVCSQNLSVGKNGEFKMSPISLDGPLATNGLKFTIKAYYPDRADHATTEVNVTGQRD